MMKLNSTIKKWQGGFVVFYLVLLLGFSLQGSPFGNLIWERLSCVRIAMGWVVPVYSIVFPEVNKIKMITWFDSKEVTSVLPYSLDFLGISQQSFKQQVNQKLKKFCDLNSSGLIQVQFVNVGSELSEKENAIIEEFLKLYQHYEFEAPCFSFN